MVEDPVMNLRRLLAAVLIAVTSALVTTTAPANAAAPYIYPTFKGDGAADQERGERSVGYREHQVHVGARVLRGGLDGADHRERRADC
jgi:hypothetical protein